MGEALSWILAGIGIGLLMVIAVWAATGASSVAGGARLASGSPVCSKCGSSVRMYKGTVDGDVSIIWVECRGELAFRDAYKRHVFKCENVADFAQFFPGAPAEPAKEEK